MAQTAEKLSQERVTPMTEASMATSRRLPPREPEQEIFEGEPKEQWRKDMDAGKQLDPETGIPARAYILFRNDTPLAVYRFLDRAEADRDRFARGSDGTIGGGIFHIKDVPLW